MPKCNRIDTQLSINNVGHGYDEKYSLFMEFGKQLVQRIDTKPSYTYSNLVGETGGLLGLTLGLGGFGVYELIYKFIESQNWPKTTKKTLLFIIGLTQIFCFVFFSSQAAIYYISEPLTFTRTLENDEFNFPLLTCCPHPLYYFSQNEHSFYSNVEATLKKNADDNKTIGDINAGSYCKDSDQYLQECPGWADYGYCGNGEYTDFMLSYCNQSCGLCGEIGKIETRTFDIGRV